MVILDIIILAIILVIIIALPIVVIQIINKKHTLPLWLKIAAPISFILVASISTGLIYLSIHYKATKDVEPFLVSDSSVEVSKKDKYYFFDNKTNDDKAVIFYGGAKVEERSYAPLARKLADKGVDVFLVTMPFRLPLFDVYQANNIYKAHSNYKEVYLMGHSLGGTTISMCLEKSVYDYKGIIFLASFPNSQIDNKFKALSIYGDKDKILNKNTYENRKAYFPSGYVTKVIEGGNHCQFGYYGDQVGDGKALISREEQVNTTVGYILDFINH